MKKKGRKVSPFLRYSGWGIQLLAGCALFAWLGYQLDSYLKWKFPVFLLLFLCLSLGGQLYKMYRDLTSDE